MRQTVFVCGYPKSGTTWLTRLLGDILNSPTGGSIASEDKNEIAAEGLDRTGSYIVRKGHYRLVDAKELVPAAHQMAWEHLRDERIIFIVRDPRDICISGAYHWNTSPEQFLDRMIKGDVAKVGRWDDYVGEWLNPLLPHRPYASARYASVRYESLLTDTPFHAKLLLSSLRLRGRYIERAVERQSFESISQRIPLEQHKRNNLRLGISGDWKHHFSDDMRRRIWKEFGHVMRRLGYEH